LIFLTALINWANLFKDDAAHWLSYATGFTNWSQAIAFVHLNLWISDDFFSG